MLIDCGCILGARADFLPVIADIKTKTGGVIDVLVVTHEHADHINGFKLCADAFARFEIGEAWFAWTEDESDELANDLRQNHSKLKMALQMASDKLTKLQADKHYEHMFAEEYHQKAMLAAKEKFIGSVSQLNNLSMNLGAAAKGKVPSMVTLFKQLKILKKDTDVYFFSPGELYDTLERLPGIRVFVLGPPRDPKMLNITEVKGEHYEKRESKSNKDLALADVMMGKQDDPAMLPFEPEYELTDANAVVRKAYEAESWRNIEHDWLYSVGGLALRYESSINNTSLALAFQFESSERVLLFPGDAEFGNWQSWYDWEWTVNDAGEKKKVDAGYLLANTVFYKVGHHSSQNGTASAIGLEKMEHEELSAMVPLSFRKIQSVWLNTMPNDHLCAELIARCQGRVLFSGDRDVLMKNIKTPRVSVKKSHEATLNALNKVFDGKIYVEYEVKS
jgi:hypothetical protein